MHVKMLYVYIMIFKKKMNVLSVWNELEKENKEFFEPYYMKWKGKDERVSEEETTQIIQKMISESDSSKDAKDS